MNMKMGYPVPEKPGEFSDDKETIEGDEGRYKSPTEEACAGLQGVVGRLAEIVEEFEHRLRPVMSVEGDSPTAEARMKGPIDPSDSPLVNSLNGTVVRLQEIHQRQLAILQRLQV